MDSTHSARDNIPVPPGLPILGNVLEIQDEVPIHGLERVVEQYGEIIRLNLFGRERMFIASAELLDELCDEKRFWKTPSDSLASLSSGKKASAEPRSYSGLFTAPSEDDLDWQQAHRTLMPAFGPLSIQEMFDEMHDIASQLVLKWARKGPAYRIPVTDDFTRLTLDTIALCAMDYRFNSFYQDEMDPFVQAMNTTLSASSDRLKIGSMIRKMMPWDGSAEKLKADRLYMRDVSHELVQYRRDHPTDKHDLLNVMINGKDPKTGETMSDGLISANMTTFLIAGHETTSGLLSFAFLYLLQNPSAYFKAQQEVDRVLGKGKMKPEHLKDLKYIDAVLRETLRLSPTAPAFTRSIRKDNANDFEPLAGGKYAIGRDDKVTCLITKCQRDPKVYGKDANEFKPERMLDGEFQKLPKGAWKPFGTGVRACIGRAFAWQEAQMAIAMLLQNFHFRLDDPSYQMKIKQTLTIKPAGFYMRATLREGVTAASLLARLSSSEDAVKASISTVGQSNSAIGLDLKPMTILYGSNTGTCMSLAQKLSVDARKRGHKADVMEMDAAVGTLPKDRPVVIITSSYEGQPPDNATHFVAWLESAAGREALEGVQYAVFGCGHRDWSSTFHRIPTLVDGLLAKHGSNRLVGRGLSDAADGDMFSDFETWSQQSFWPKVAPDSTADNSPVDLELEMSTQDRSSYLRQDVQVLTVTEARRLTAVGEPEKRHLEVKLPEGMTYVAGDYLAVLPLNPAVSVKRVMKHFEVSSSATLRIKEGAATFLPTGVSVLVVDVLKGYVELSQPATKTDIQTCVGMCTIESEKSALKVFTEQYTSEVAERRTSLLDILARFPSVNMSFSTFLSMLPPLRPRHYSISSSPLADPMTCTITYGIVNEAAKSGTGHYIGVTSTYLAGLNRGDEILVSVRSTNKYFHLPADPTTTPIMMFGAGTGLAPFRGFIQERAQQLAASRKLAPALLFMGCRSSSRDRLYADEMDEWAKVGAVDIRYAFSQEPERAGGCRYVGDRMLQDREDVRRLWRANAKVFVCGSPAVSENVGEAAVQMLMDIWKAEGKDVTREEVEAWFKERRNERFVVDVFA